MKFYSFLQYRVWRKKAKQKNINNRYSIPHSWLRIMWRFCGFRIWSTLNPSHRSAIWKSMLYCTKEASYVVSLIVPCYSRDRRFVSILKWLWPSEAPFTNVNLFQYQHGQVITSIFKLWGDFTYPFPNFNGAPGGVWKWISNFIPHLIGHAISYTCCD